MPPATGLPFYRRRQTVNNFALERPQSLPIFRECVIKALKSVEMRLDLLQQSFYGPEKDIEQEIKRWLPPLIIVLKQSRILHFLCKSQLDDTVALYDKAVGDPTMVVSFDKDAIKQVLDIIDRVLQYLKTGFADLTRELKSINEYMWKYCLSFSAQEGDKYMDTAINYENQRREFHQAISFNIDDITNMAEQFETRGMRVQDLGFVARDLAERCNATHVPFLVIIPQAFENIRNAVSGMRKWLAADEAYADFLMFDVIELEQKRELQGKLVRELQVKCSNYDHKVKTAKRHFGDIQAEVSLFHNREVSLKKEKAQLVAQNKDVLVDLDLKTFRKDELRPVLDELSEYELGNYRQLEKEIDLLSIRRPAIERKLEEITIKIDVIQERKDLMAQREREVLEAKEEFKKIKKAFRKAEVEYERLDGNLARLKEIHRYKTTPEILKKIFHGMPLTARHVVNKGKRPLMDKLERSCKITAANIDHDWTRLYRALPFYPPRGEETISNDIDEIGKEFMRHVTEDMCRQSLWRWRRMHTRASLDDLKKALATIRRRDVVDMIDKDLARRASKPDIPSPTFRTVRFPKIISP